MGQNVERLGRLKLNQSNWVAVSVRLGQHVQRSATFESIDEASSGVQKAAHTDGFEGDLGDVIRTGLTKIHKDLLDFTEYQAKLNKVITIANDVLHSTASEMDGLPDSELSSHQKDTLAHATETNSPVQVSPGVMLTPAQAEKYYLDQADARQEEAATKLTMRLDKQLQELIDGLPESKYDPPKPPSDDENGGGGTGEISHEYGGTGSGGGDGRYDGPGVHNPNDLNDDNNPNNNNNSNNDGNNNGDGNGNGDDDGRPPRLSTWPPITEPPLPPYEPPLPPYEPPVWPRPDDSDPPPNVDGDGNGNVPGPNPPGSNPRLTPPPGTIGTPPGGVGGGIGGGVGGVVGGTAGGVGGAALAGGLARPGALGAAGGMGGLNGAAGAGSAPGTAGAGGAARAGGANVIAQSGGGGGRAGMMAGGGAAGGGRGGKGKRRRGQDLVAFEVDPEDDDVTPDLGAAGAAGSSTSDGREELGW
ncbi:hypothetical protein Q9R19_00675 [Microbacterium sp. ARD32]|uniref:hypothetical protein n=1 Tax=Microbacterium sp. ARD32 TaxID=2962577 RepID=UPI0028818C8D|nr:hypothetical protein [Microbacterium sp. ARD32]MDT0156134.1 hypothetical protein [Microbacterium sp. ARD32]